MVEGCGEEGRGVCGIYGDPWQSALSSAECRAYRGNCTAMVLEENVLLVLSTSLLPESREEDEGDGKAMIFGYALVDPDPAS